MSTRRPYHLNDSLDSSDMTPRNWDVYFKEDDTPEELLIKVVDSILIRLPADQRDVLHLLMSGVIVTGEGSDSGYRRAARELGICHKTVKRRLAKALTTVEQELLELPDWVLSMLGARLPVDRDVEHEPVDVFGPMRRAIEAMRGVA